MAKLKAEGIKRKDKGDTVKSKVDKKVKSGSYEKPVPKLKQKAKSFTTEGESNDSIKTFKKMKGVEYKENKKRLDESEDHGENKESKFKKKKMPDFKSGIKRKAEGDAPAEKTDWKKLKAEKKELKVKRKQKSGGNETYELCVKSKKIWEELRQEKCSDARKEELCKELHAAIKGKVKSLIFAHDTVRVIQTLVGVGSEQYRVALFEELQADILPMCKNKYARFFVMKILRNGTKQQRDKIMESFKGKVVELMTHKIACEVVELAYNDYANAKQRSSMVQEFYGPRFRLFKEEDVHNLGDALAKYPDQKEQILKDMKTYLQPIIDKGVFTNTMLHTLIKEFLMHGSNSDRAGIIESIKENLLPIIHTRDGSRVAMLCLWYGNNKDRKVILKGLKGHLVKIACEEHGNMVLLAAFDSVDDTVFLKKAIVAELMGDLETLIGSEHGKRVLKYLVAPRNRLFFHPDIINILKQGDGNPHSKKDAPVRQKEIQAAVSEPVLKMLVEKIPEWSFDTHWTLFIGAALKELNGPVLEEAFEALANICATPYVPGSDNHVLDLAHTSKMITYIIKCDKERYQNEQALFCDKILQIVSRELPGWTLMNRGCFLLINMIETEIPSVVKQVVEHITPSKDRLKKQNFKGAEILLKKI
ncbi:pumilio and CPL domain-containing protein penguin [Oratosquilla oratoria]|uniref:pumilio and CPL domain-containing protein penguin n=1 Tax=Oratosquilla oratoria TaxID=337810 RepID=UPI003F76CBC0